MGKFGLMIILFFSTQNRVNSFLMKMGFSRNLIKILINQTIYIISTIIFKKDDSFNKRRSSEKI
jgi:hypothetical protein